MAIYNDIINIGYICNANYKIVKFFFQLEKGILAAF